MGIAPPFTEIIVRFFAANLPDAPMLAVGGPVGLAWAAACLIFSGLLKKRLGTQDGVHA